MKIDNIQAKLDKEGYTTWWAEYGRYNVLHARINDSENFIIAEYYNYKNCSCLKENFTWYDVQRYLSFGEAFTTIGDYLKKDSVKEQIHDRWGNIVN